MAWPLNTVRLSCALLAWAAAVPGSMNAQAAGTEFSAEVGLGGEYDSNVSVDELDATSNESDYAYTVDADLGLDQQIRSKQRVQTPFLRIFQCLRPSLSSLP